MKQHTFRSIVLASVLALVLSGLAHAAVQLYIISNTTLAAAVSQTATTVTLTSASASSGSSFGAPSAGQCLFVDRELMTIVSMASTVATVRRGLTNGSPHASGATVFTAPCAMFKTADPVPSGNVDCTMQPGPWINVNNGNMWFCSVNRWIGANAAPLTYNSVLLVS